MRAPLRSCAGGLYGANGAYLQECLSQDVPDQYLCVHIIVEESKATSNWWGCGEECSLKGYISSC